MKRPHPSIAILASAIAIVIEVVMTNAGTAGAEILPDGRSKVCETAAGVVVPEANNANGAFAGQTTPLPLAGYYRIDYGTGNLALGAKTSSTIVASALAGGDRNLRAGDPQRAAYLAYETTLYHECAHARTGNLVDEVAINCTAYMSMLHVGELSGHDLYLLALVWHSPAMNATLVPPQFSGSIADYFDATMQCVNWALSNPGRSPQAGIASPFALDTSQPK